MSAMRAATIGLLIAYILAACGSESPTPSAQGDGAGSSANTGAKGNAGSGTAGAVRDGSGGTSSGEMGTAAGGKNAPSGGGGGSAGKVGGGAGGRSGSGAGKSTGLGGGASGAPGSNTAGNANGGTSGGGGKLGAAGATSGGGGNLGAAGATSGGGGKQPGQDGGTGKAGANGTGGGGKSPTGDDAKYPFPQNVKYPYGVQSTKVTSEHVKTWYDAWSKKYLQQCNGNLRPGVDPLSKSLVEAQGFAMVAAAYMGDKTVFDKLYNFYKAKTTSAGCGLMGWKNSCEGWEDQGAATDGDIDVASGLVVANWQWPGGGYDEKAKGVLSNLKKMILNCGGKSALYPGCSGGRPWGGCNETDISYYSPAFFRYFAKVTGDEGWTKLADDTHLIRDAAANSKTGLVPDWQSVSGTAGSGSRKGYYSFDAIRTPYKQALDYLWNGNEKALAWCKKITTWAHGFGVEELKDGFQLNGTLQGSSHNMATVGSLAVAAMANTQEIADAFAEESVKIKDDYWYSGYLGTLYLLAMSGNMWNPDIVANQP